MNLVQIHIKTDLRNCKINQCLVFQSADLNLSFFLKKLRSQIQQSSLKNKSLLKSQTIIFPAKQKKTQRLQRMIIFLLAILVLTGALIVNFLPSLKTNRVLVMSVLAILMIMINFINEIDIIVSPPQLLVKIDSVTQGRVKRQVIKLNLKQEFETKRMKYFTKTMTQLKGLVHNSLNQPNSLTQQTKKSITQQQQTLPPKSHIRPIIKPELYLMDQLKNRMIESEDSVIHIQGIQKTRFQLLMQFYMKDVNEKSQSYGLKFEKVIFVPIYVEDMKESISKGYKFAEKLSQKDYHYIVVFDYPSQKFLQFLYEQYTSSKSPYLTILFLELNENVNIFPISRFIEPIIMPQMTYLQPITQFFIAKTQTAQKKESKDALNKMKEQLEICQKYVQIDYDFFLRILAFSGHQTIAKTCYENLLQPVDEEIECLRTLIQKEDDQIPLYKAKKCWKGKKQPNGLVKTAYDRVKLKKQHFWVDKVTPTDFGMQVVTKKCSNEL